MKQNGTKYAWLGIVALMLLASAILMQPVRVSAQATATNTATATATATSVATATPIATALPMAQSLTGFAQGVRIGQYGITWSTSGDGLQLNGGAGLSINSATGKPVFHVDGSTGAQSGFTVLSTATSITVTTAAFTPLGTYQPIAAAGTVTPTISTSGFTAGTLLRLVNTSAQSIVFVDTSTLMLTGDITLGQYDTLSLVFDGTNWIELSTSNN
jgi:hypothetical protein